MDGNIADLIAILISLFALAWAKASAVAARRSATAAEKVHDLQEIGFKSQNRERLIVLFAEAWKRGGNYTDAVKSEWAYWKAHGYTREEFDDIRRSALVRIGKSDEQIERHFNSGNVVLE